MTVYSVSVRNGAIVSQLCFALKDNPSIFCGGGFYLGLPSAAPSDLNWCLMDCEEGWEWLCAPSQAVSPNASPAWTRHTTSSDSATYTVSSCEGSVTVICFTDLL